MKNYINMKYFKLENKKNDLTDINSNFIPFKNKDYTFVYEHSLEDIFKYFKNKNRLILFT